MVIKKINGKKSKVSLDSKGKGKQDNSFPIIGIGASAGGLEAFEEFFRFMPPESGMAFVLIPHLDPDHASMRTRPTRDGSQQGVRSARMSFRPAGRNLTKAGR